MLRVALILIFPTMILWLLRVMVGWQARTVD